MKKLEDSWKNREVFERQLELNKKELESPQNYPAHWVDIIRIMRELNVKKMLDIGCGCGAFSSVCNTEFPELTYVGTDYSEEAIKIARNEWENINFQVLDYKDMTNKHVKEYDLVCANALLDIMQNGDEVLEKVLSTKPKNLIISRIRFTNGDSFYKTYKAYNIETYSFYHGRNKFKDICEKYGYTYPNISNDFYGAILLSLK